MPTAHHPDFEFRFLHPHVEPKAQTLIGGLRIEGPSLPHHRTPLDLVACVDVSGSMMGDKLERVQKSLEKLVEQLSDRDRLGIVTFHSEVKVVLPLAEMTAEAKVGAKERIRRLQALELTNLGGGLLASLHLLEGGSRREAIRRVLLFTDGHANVGLSNGDIEGFATLLQSAEGVSTSFFGYGEDHDGPFLARLAEIAEGGYHQAADPDGILHAFGRELGGLLSVAALGLEISVRPLPGAGEPRFLNDFRSRARDGAVILHLPELYAKEVRWVVFELPFARPASPLPAERELVEVEVRWMALPGGTRERTSLRGGVELAGGKPSVPDPDLKQQWVILRAGAAQRQAMELSMAGQFAAARDVVVTIAGEAAALGTDAGALLASTLHQAAEAYGNPNRFKGTRSSLRSLSFAMGKGRAAGSAADALFETIEQTKMRTRFRGDAGNSNDSKHSESEDS